MNTERFGLNKVQRIRLGDYVFFVIILLSMGEGHRLLSWALYAIWVFIDFMYTKHCLQEKVRPVFGKVVR